MFAEERRLFIQNALRTDKRVDVLDLASRMAMSPETVRRDLREMEADGLLKRTHGGAILAPQHDEGAAESPLIQRKNVANYDKKLSIAKRAASFVKSDDVIALDNSSTASLLLRHIPYNYVITIITNSIALVADFIALPDCNWTCVSLGGIVSAHSNATFGSPSLAVLTHFRPHKLFISCAGVDAAGTITAGNLNDAEMKRALLGCSQERFLLVDETKFSRSGAVNCAKVTDFDYVVTNKTIDPLCFSPLLNTSVKLIYDSESVLS